MSKTQKIVIITVAVALVVAVVAFCIFYFLGLTGIHHHSEPKEGQIKVACAGAYTRLGYWHDRKGENEIDIVAEDELDNKIEFIEVKRQAKNFDENVLKSKSELFFKAIGTFKGYEIIYRGLSIEDM